MMRHPLRALYSRSNNYLYYQVPKCIWSSYVYFGNWWCNFSCHYTLQLKLEDKMPLLKIQVRTRVKLRLNHDKLYFATTTKYRYCIRGY